MDPGGVEYIDGWQQSRVACCGVALVPDYVRHKADLLPVDVMNGEEPVDVFVGDVLQANTRN